MQTTCTIYDISTNSKGGFISRLHFFDRTEEEKNKIRQVEREYREDLTRTASLLEIDSRRTAIIKKKKALEGIKEKTREEKQELRSLQNQLFETNNEFKQAVIKDEQMEHLQRLQEIEGKKPSENNAEIQGNDTEVENKNTEIQGKNTE